MRHTATHHNTLQHTATNLPHTGTHCNTLWPFLDNDMQISWIYCNTSQHNATRRNTLQHTATHCNTLQHTIIRLGQWHEDLLNLCANMCACLYYVCQTKDICWQLRIFKHVLFVWGVLQCVAVCCSVLHLVSALNCWISFHVCCSAGVAVCCVVLCCN